MHLWFQNAASTAQIVPMKVESQLIHLRDGELVLYRRERSQRFQCRYKLTDGTWHRQSIFAFDEGRTILLLVVNTTCCEQLQLFTVIGTCRLFNISCWFFLHRVGKGGR